jgi:signal transduction histidine kinase
LIIKEAINYKAEYYQRKIDLKIDIKDCKIRISEKYLVKIIEELIDNAFKFSKPGSEIFVKTYAEDKNYFLVVHDKGRGMTTEDIDNIGAYVQFDRNFYEQQGNGLGLSIVQKIVDLHEGVFKIISEKNLYTKVIISLPIV